MASLLKVVPHTLMEPFPNYAAILPGALPAFLVSEMDDIDSVLGYISGALNHQDCMANETEKMVSKVFKGVITDVTFVERKSGDYLLGKKAVIHFTGAGQKGADEAQEISTDWYEYHSYNPELEAFWVALSQTVVAVARDNIGVECLIRKSFKSAETANGGNSVRYIASLTPIAGGKKAAAPAKKAPGKKPSERVQFDGDDDLKLADVIKMIESDKEAGGEYDDADPKVAKQVAKMVLDTLNDDGDIDQRYQKFVDLVDYEKVPRSAKNLILDALEDESDKRAAAALFVLGIQELG